MHVEASFGLECSDAYNDHQQNHNHCKDYPNRDAARGIEECEKCHYSNKHQPKDNGQKVHKFRLPLHHSEIQNGQPKRNQSTNGNALDLLEKVVAVSHIDVLVQFLL